MNDLMLFKAHLDEFCDRFSNSELKKELDDKNKALYESRDLNLLNEIKMEIENELSHIVDLPRDRRGQREQELLKSYQDLKVKINDLPEVKSYLEAYNKVKEIKDILNEKIFEVIA